MKAVLLGASKGMGRALARLLAARGDRLFLLGDHVEELTISAGDLEIRGAAAPVKAGPLRSAATGHVSRRRWIKPSRNSMVSIRSWLRPASSRRKKTWRTIRSWPRGC